MTRAARPAWSRENTVTLTVERLRTVAVRLPVANLICSVADSSADRSYDAPDPRAASVEERDVAAADAGLGRAAQADRGDAGAPAQPRRQDAHASRGRIGGAARAGRAGLPASAVVAGRSERAIDGRGRRGRRDRWDRRRHPGRRSCASSRHRSRKPLPWSAGCAAELTRSSSWSTTGTLPDGVLGIVAVVVLPRRAGDHERVVDVDLDDVIALAGYEVHRDPHGMRDGAIERLCDVDLVESTCPALVDCRRDVDEIDREPRRRVTQPEEAHAPPLPESGLMVTARPGCSAPGVVDMNRNVVSKCG